MNTSKTILALALLLLPAAGRAQSVSGKEKNAFQRATSSLEGEVELAAQVAKEYNPLWVASNDNGLSDPMGSNCSLAAYVEHDEHEAPHKWRLSWGLGVQASLLPKNDFNSSTELYFVIPQAYVDVDYKKVRLSVGSKMKYDHALKGELTSGSQTFGNNALPVPAVRFEIPEYISIGKWVGIKGHFGYGVMTDGAWQQDYLEESAARYAKNVLLHTKAGYLRIGNKDAFPVTLEGGLEMATQFGGTVYNYGEEKATIKMPGGASDFFKAIYSGGSDVTDGPYANAGGNTLGSWLFAVNYYGKGWGLKAYYDHFFEDHSQMFLQYGWFDGLMGLEVELPENRFVSRVCYEHLKTSYQSGPISHDHTEALPMQISGGDDYYNHVLYQGWQHFGQAMGNPLFFSPLFRNDGTLGFNANRFTAHYVALSGSPVKGLDYTLRYSYLTSWGTYNIPFEAELHQTSLGLSLDWTPERIGRLALPGWGAFAAVGLDFGHIIHHNRGFMLGVTKAF
ncbi:MAG: hypothetical protein IJ692_02340 [Alloprevotella sp.]|nr:hypothetical protein [Alloprevotella sp.]